MKKKISTIQHGDVLFKRVDELPDGVESVSKGRIVVAHGESGHSHVINARPDAAEMFRLGERMFLKIVKPSMLVHEEHHQIQLSPGIYEVGRVREFDWFSQMERRVVD